MKDGRRNTIGDLVMASVTGCAMFMGIIAISVTFFTSLSILIALFK